MLKSERTRWGATCTCALPRCILDTRPVQLYGIVAVLAFAVIALGCGSDGVPDGGAVDASTADDSGGGSGAAGTGGSPGDASIDDSSASDGSPTDGGTLEADASPDAQDGSTETCKGWKRGHLKFEGDFESGDLTGFSVSGNPSTVVTSPVRVGAYSLRSFLDRFHDPISYRTEVVPLEKPDALVGDDMWYGFSIYLPDSYISDPIWEIVAQWHARPDFDIGEDWRNPPLSLHTANGVWLLSNIWDAKKNTFESGKREYDGSRKFELGPYETGRWTDWVLHVKWSYTSDGVLQVWQDGKLVVDAPGPNTFNDERGPIPKIGIYKGWKHPDTPGVVKTRELFHDEFRIGVDGASYCDVAPGDW